MKVEITGMRISNEDLEVIIFVNEEEISIVNFPLYLNAEDISEVVEMMNFSKTVQNSLRNGFDQQLLKNSVG